MKTNIEMKQNAYDNQYTRLKIDTSQGDRAIIVPSPLDYRERSGSVVECLTRDRRTASSSLTGVTALCSLSKTHLS